MLASAALLLPALTVVAPGPAAAATVDPCGPGGNKIACENTKPGNPESGWDNQVGAGSNAIQGFATEMSVNVGQRVDFKIDTAASSYTIGIYRTGYYQGNGARKIAQISPSVPLPQIQPPCITDVATELFDCGNWAVSASWNVPSTAVSGVYFAVLKLPNGQQSQIPFVVRDDSSTADIVFQTSDTTWQAYNSYGGSSFYEGGANGRAYKLSYNRPFNTRTGERQRDFYFGNEYPMVRFLERNGYDVTYIAGADTDRRGHLLTNHKVFLSVGHDEYWSGKQRQNVEAARDAGVHLMFLSGNEVYWRTRWENSADASHAPYRTLVSYKETWAHGKIDPSNEWTGTWRDPRFASPAQGGGKPENALTGTMYFVNHDDLPVQVNANEGKLRLWRNTPLASLAAGATATLAPHTVGYESNEDADNGFRPPGLIRLSTTVGPTPEYLQDFGNVVAPGTTTHHLTMYRAPSGALVFSAGSVQWTWGLDANHDSAYAPEPADPRMQQAQINLFADMGVQPTTLMAGMVQATKSTDTVGPTVSISSPAAGATRPNGESITVSGTATDSGGGRVAGVEVSLDNGATWHPATGTSSWTYTGVLHGMGSVTIRVRAADDSANIGPVANRTLNVPCPCSAFGAEAPKVASMNDPTPLELGLRFTPETSGYILGVRFHKGAGNGGTHVGRLWTSSGQLLSSVTFANESPTGWQTAMFASPVAVTAGVTYVVSYSDPQGHYSAADYYFTYAPVKRGPFQLAGGWGAQPAGVYGQLGEFPTQSYANANYYVDALFSTTDTSPLTVLGRTPIPDASSVPVGTTITATFSKHILAGSAQLTVKNTAGQVIPGANSYSSATRTVTFTPAAALERGATYSVTATATDQIGNQVSANGTWSFTTARPPGVPGVCPCSLFDDDTTPQMLDAGDDRPVNLGVRFVVNTPGTITALRFYKSPANVGTHTGTLWKADGTTLATGTFANESSVGWQTLTFSQPVEVAPGTEYIASYRSPIGNFSVTPNAFSSQDLSKGPLRVDSSSGAFTYGTGMPTNPIASNYLVDVVFEKVAPTLEITAQDPIPGALDVPRGDPIRVWFSAVVTSAASLTAKIGNTPVAGSQTLGNGGTRLTFTPSSALPANATVTVELKNVVSTEGVALPNQTWTFTTLSGDATGVQTIFGDAVPATAAVDDGASVELGTAFVPSRGGVVRALRFHKGPGNGGTHLGSLWGPNGNRIAQVTFSNETASGWQRAALSTPVRVDSGQTYVVSYFAPQGHYSVTSGFFSNPVVSGQLTAPATSNGRYRYGGSSGYPANSYGATSYFVDVEFVPDPPTITIDSRSPAAGATGVLLSAKPSVTFSEPIAEWYQFTASVGSTGIPGTVSISTNRKKLTFTPNSALPSNAEITMRVNGVVSQDGAVLGQQTWTFHTIGTGGTLTTLFGSSTPAVSAVDDDNAVELGVSFVPSTNGHVTAIRFYKGAGNTGTHTGTLWTSSGAVLATGTFTDETASGWQTLEFPNPIPVTAGQTYVASYYAPKGRYAATQGYFAEGYTQGPITVPAQGNGRYRYGSGGGFPTNSWNNTNYWVGVVFAN